MSRAIDFGAFSEPRLTPFARILLLAVLALALAARLWGVTFGLPQTLAKPDEDIVVARASAFFFGDWNPHFFNYPSLFLYLVHFAVRGVYWFGAWRGDYANALEFLIDADYRPELIYLPARLLSVAFGVGSVYLLYAIGRDAGSRRAGLLAAFWLAIGYLHGRQSHFGVTDVAAVFFVLGSILGLVRRTHAGASSSAFFGAAVFAGLATSTKYIGCFLFAPAAILEFRRWRCDPARPNFWRGVVAPLFGFGLVMVVCFCLTTPYGVLASHELIRDLKYESEFLDTGYHPIGEPGFKHHSVFTLPIGLGEPIFAIGVVAVAWMARRDWKLAVAVLGFPLLYFLVTGSGRAVFVRYILPVVPPLTFAAAWLFDRAFAAVENRMGRRLGAPLFGVCAVLLAAPSALRLYHFDRLSAATDTRELASQWLITNASGSTFVQLDVPYATLRVPDEPSHAVKRLASRIPPGLEGYVEAYVKKLAAARPMPWLEEWKVQKDGSFTRDGEAKSGYPDYIVVQRSRHKDMWADRQKIVEGLGYVRVAEFRSLPDDGDHRFDLQDAFYIPYDGFDAVERPGPNVVIYRHPKKKARR